MCPMLCPRSLTLLPSSQFVLRSYTALGLSSLHANQHTALYRPRLLRSQNRVSSCTCLLSPRRSRRRDIKDGQDESRHRSPCLHLLASRWSANKGLYVYRCSSSLPTEQNVYRQSRSNH